MRIAHHEKQILDMNEADGVIEVVAAQRETRVLRLDRLFTFVSKSSSTFR